MVCYDDDIHRLHYAQCYTLLCVSIPCYIPGLGGALFCGENSMEFRRTVPPERLPSPRVQFRHGNSSQISGIRREFRNFSKVFKSSSETPKNNRGNFLILRKIPKKAAARDIIAAAANRLFAVSNELFFHVISSGLQRSETEGLDQRIQLLSSEWAIWLAAEAVVFFLS